MHSGFGQAQAWQVGIDVDVGHTLATWSYHFQHSLLTITDTCPFRFSHPAPPSDSVCTASSEHVRSPTTSTQLNLCWRGFAAHSTAKMSYTPTSYYGHSVKDRTSEFHGLVESFASRSTAPAAKQKLLSTPGASPKGEFARRAQAIGKDIASTTSKLQRLAQRKHTFCIWVTSTRLS